MSTLEQAIRHHQQGQLEQAESIYRQLLQADAHDGEATHLLGLVEVQKGNLEIGESLLQRAVSLAAEQPLYRFNHALVLAEMRQWPAALAELRSVLEIAPHYPDAYLQAAMMCLNLE
ncbi:tetratricopeptide repeat protein, partial [Methylogaea oryzae]